MRELLVENKLRTIPFEYKIIDKLSTKIVVISKYMEKLFSNEIDNEKVVLIYNGLEQFDRNKIEISEPIKNILIAGTLIPAKGQIEAIKAIEIVNKAGFNVTLHIVGSDPNAGKRDSYKKELELEIKNSGVSSKVIFYGEIRDMNALRDKMEIELVCSKCEAFGRVVVEAMQKGLIVIGSNTGAIPELIKDNYNGMIYISGDYRDLANKIMNILKSPSLATKMSSNAFGFSKNHFTLNETINNIEGLIKNMLL